MKKMSSDMLKTAIATIAAAIIAAALLGALQTGFQERIEKPATDTVSVEYHHYTFVKDTVITVTVTAPSLSDEDLQAIQDEFGFDTVIVE